MTLNPTPDEIAQRYILMAPVGTIHILDLLAQLKDGIYAKDILCDHYVGILYFGAKLSFIKPWEAALAQMPFSAKTANALKERTFNSIAYFTDRGPGFLAPDGAFLQLELRYLLGSNLRPSWHQLSLLNVITIKKHPGFESWVQKTFYAGRGPLDTQYVRVHKFESKAACDRHVNSRPYTPGPLSVPQRAIVTPAPVFPAVQTEQSSAGHAQPVVASLKPATEIRPRIQRSLIETTTPSTIHSQKRRLEDSTGNTPKNPAKKQKMNGKQIHHPITKPPSTPKSYDIFDDFEAFKANLARQQEKFQAFDWPVDQLLALPEAESKAKARKPTNTTQGEGPSQMKTTIPLNPTDAFKTNHSAPVKTVVPVYPTPLSNTKQNREHDLNGEQPNQLKQKETLPLNLSSAFKPNLTTPQLKPTASATKSTPQTKTTSIPLSPSSAFKTNFSSQTNLPLNLPSSPPSSPEPTEDDPINYGEEYPGQFIVENINREDWKGYRIISL